MYFVNIDLLNRIYLKCLFKRNQNETKTASLKPLCSLNKTEGLIVEYMQLQVNKEGKLRYL